MGFDGSDEVSAIQRCSEAISAFRRLALSFLKLDTTAKDNGRGKRVVFESDLMKHEGILRSFSAA